MSENKFWISLWLGLMLTTILFFAIVLHYDFLKDTKMAELGYQKVTIAGASYPQWQKVGEEKR